MKISAVIILVFVLAACTSVPQEFNSAYQLSKELASRQAYDAVLAEENSYSEFKHDFHSDAIPHYFTNDPGNSSVWISSDNSVALKFQASEPSYVSRKLSPSDRHNQQKAFYLLVELCVKNFSTSCFYSRLLKDIDSGKYMIADNIDSIESEAPFIETGRSNNVITFSQAAIGLSATTVKMTIDESVLRIECSSACFHTALGGWGGWVFNRVSLDEFIAFNKETEKYLAVYKEILKQQKKKDAQARNEILGALSQGLTIAASAYSEALAESQAMENSLHAARAQGITTNQQHNDARQQAESQQIVTTPSPGQAHQLANTATNDMATRRSKESPMLARQSGGLANTAWGRASGASSSSAAHQVTTPNNSADNNAQVSKLNAYPEAIIACTRPDAAGRFRCGTPVGVISGGPNSTDWSTPEHVAAWATASCPDARRLNSTTHVVWGCGFGATNNSNSIDRSDGVDVQGRNTYFCYPKQTSCRRTSP